MYIKQLTVSMLALAMLFGCKETDKERLTRLVAEWQGKKIMSIAFVAAIAVAAAWNFSQSSKAEVLSDIALDNVEALAECEKTFGSC
jgi:uncharacterized Rmd1/YagE family protein